MINSLKSYLAPFIAGTIFLSLNACSPSLTNQTNGSTSSNNTSQNTGNTPTEALQLTFGVYTADKPTTVVKEFRPTLNALEDKMSEIMKEPVKIKMEVANSYERGIEDLVEGRVDFSRLGPASYVTAKEANPELSILAIETKGGEKVFYGIIAVHQDSNIQNVSQLVGKSFAFGDELSTIGRFLSQQYLLENGIKSSNLSKFGYLGRHDKVGTAVGLKQFDAGALKEGTFKKLVNNGIKIRSIAKFPNVQKPWVSRSELPEEVYNALSQALLDISNSETVFVPGSDQDYQIIQEAMENNSQFFL